MGVFILKEFSPGQKSSNVKPVPGVYWVVEKHGILLVSPERPSYLKLDQTESAVWQMLNAGIDLQRIFRFLALIKGFSFAEVENYFEKFCEYLKKQGYLQPAGT